MLKPNALPFIFAMMPVGPGIDKKTRYSLRQYGIGGTIFVICTLCMVNL